MLNGGSTYVFMGVPMCIWDYLSVWYYLCAYGSTKVYMVVPTYVYMVVPTYVYMVVHLCIG